ncbi:hypothetical protein [Peterkaempfera bronchialis]|uniref:hypothetical protein n=1 Tax=Peterkaempfera bronchialis TaxID=2126346 RepID=UPI003C2EF7A9
MRLNHLFWQLRSLPGNTSAVRFAGDLRYGGVVSPTDRAVPLQAFRRHRWKPGTRRLKATPEAEAAAHAAGLDKSPLIWNA